MSFTHRCFVIGCEHHYGVTLPVGKRGTSEFQKTSLFNVPKDPIQLAKWREVVPKGGRELLRGRDRICHRHFAPGEVETSFRTIVNTGSGSDIFEIPRARPLLKKGAVPSIFPDPAAMEQFEKRRTVRKPKPALSGIKKRSRKTSVEPSPKVSERTDRGNSLTEPRTLYLEFDDLGKPIIRTEPASPSQCDEPVIHTRTEPSLQCDETVVNTKTEPSQWDESVVNTRTEPSSECDEPVVNTRTEPSSQWDETVVNTKTEPSSQWDESVVNTRTEPLSQWDEPVVSVGTEPSSPAREWNEPVIRAKLPREELKGMTFSDLKASLSLIPLPSPLWGSHSGPNLVAFTYFSNELYDKGFLCEKGVVFQGNVIPKVMFHGIEVQMFISCLNSKRQVTSIGCIERVIRTVHLKRTCAGIRQIMNGRQQFSEHCRGYLMKKENDRCMYCCKYEPLDVAILE